MTNRIPLIAGNWKMFKTCSEAVEAAEQLVKLVAMTSDKCSGHGVSETTEEFI